MTDCEAKQMMLGIAEDYEKLANRAGATSVVADRRHSRTAQEQS
jgi:hypothetical protein